MKVAALMLLLVGWATAQVPPPPYCNPVTGTKPAPTDPPFPTLPASFQTRVEANILENNYTMTATEYVDTDNNRASLLLRAGGSTDYVYFNYAANEVYYVEGGLDCEVHSNISADPDSALFGYSTNTSRLPHVYSTANVLKFAATFGEVYRGRTAVRGIPVDHWQTCMYWPDMAANFTLDYYFTVANWITTDAYPQSPVRAEVQGLLTIAPWTPQYPTAVTQPFHHIYDYFDFRHSVTDDDSVFETPDNVICPGRKKMRDLPQLKSQYRYREEIITPLSATVVDADVWYDYSYGLVRFDYRPGPDMPPFYSSDPFTDIHDYNTGVAYSIDKLMQNCTISPIMNGTWDGFRNKSQAYLKIRDPRQLFFLDSSYEYAGVRQARNIDCDVFMSNRTDFNVPEMGYVPTVFSMFFMTDEWASANAGGADSSETDVPIRLLITEPSTQFQIQYDFFDFDEEHPSLISNFDITPCFSDAQQIKFRVTFPTTNTDFLNTYKVVFQNAGLLGIAQTAQISPLRIQHTEVHWAANNVYLVATILEKPPPIAKYQKSQVPVARTQNDVTQQNVADAYTCAQLCDSSGVNKVQYNSFDYCGSQQICTLSTTYQSKGAVVDNSALCDHYTRVLGGVAETDLSLHDAWVRMKDLTSKGSFNVTVKTDTQTYILKATDITDMVWGISVLQNSTNPPFPTLPASFQTRVEANILENNYTMTATEYVDTDNNRASLLLRAGGSTDYVYFNYAANEVYYVEGGLDCEVHSNISADPDSALFGYSTNTSRLPHVYSTANVLKFAATFGEVYKGRTTVRGIPVDHWQTSMYWADMAANFTLDYYFTIADWITTDAYPQSPVRAEVQGLLTIAPWTPQYPTAVTQPFHHIYDYFDFRHSVTDDDSVFETPDNVICPGRKKMRDLPQLKSQYRYREEIITPLSATVVDADVWYDYSYGLVRFDYRPGQDMPPFYSSDPFTDIHDYNTGVAYSIDKLMQNCTISPIMNGTWDGFRNKSQVYLKIRDPRQLFFLDSSYEYSGVRQARNIDCDVFMSNRTDFNVPEMGYVPTVFSMFFMTDEWASANAGGADSSETDVPIRLLITEPSTQFQIQYDFFDFDEEHPSLISNFDITPCFSDSEKIKFRVTFPTTNTDFLNTYKVVFQNLGLVGIAQTAQISPLRIQHTEVHWDANNVYLVATILEKPPPIAKYQKSLVPVARTQNDVTQQNVADAYTCAQLCDSSSSNNVQCNSFDYCGSQQICTLSTTYQSKGAVVDNSALCDHYTRVLGGVAETDLSLHDAWVRMKDLTFKGGFIVTVQTDTQTYILKATDVTDQVVGSSTLQKSTILSHFTGQTNKVVQGFDDAILTGDSVDECATQCENEIVFTCQSFEYCYDNGYCILSHMHPDDRPDLVQPSQTCDLFFRDYTAMYDKRPGTTVLSSSDTIYQNIYSDNQCAKLCNDYNDFPCKSFDFCPDINTCFLGRQHVFDVPKANIQQNPTCSHYSRSYVYDFQLKANKVVSMRDDRVVVGISADQCAKMCVEEESFQCSSFDYCGNATECRLSTADMRVGQVTLEASAFCSVYQRQYYPSAKPNAGSCDAASYNAGSMAGLGISMIIVGIVMGIAGILLFYKLRSGRSDGMQVAFSMQEHVSE